MSAGGPTIAEQLQWMTDELDAAGVFFGHGTDNAWDEAVALLLSVLAIEPANAGQELLAETLDSQQCEQLNDLLKRRIEERLPAAYLTGEAWFCGLSFKVNEHVLVPRSPIAELIESGFAPWLSSERAINRVLDMGTGSGCIAIACAYAFPAAQVDAVDVSFEALAVTRDNIAAHELAGRVDALVSDIWSNLQGRHYDLIVSNPPYVSAAEMAVLPAEYYREPILGLQAADDGLALVHRILAGAAEHLAEDGILVVEVGNSEAALVAAYPEVPFTWLSFEHGGSGVFLLDEQALKRWFPAPY